MTATPTLHDRYLNKDGKCRIKIYIYIDKGNEKRISTPYYVDPVKEWDEENHCCNKKRANYEFINNELKKLCLEYETKFLKGSRNIDDLVESKHKTFYQFIQDYLKDLEEGKILHKKTGKPLSANTIRSIPTYTNYIFAYFAYAGKKFNFKDIDTDFYHGFMHYLRNEYDNKKGVSENTIIKAVKTVQALMTRAKKLHDNKDYMDMTLGYLEIDNIYLTDEEVERIVNLGLTGTPHLELERDRFIVAYNFLLRYMDSITIDPSEIRTMKGKYYLDFYTQKTATKVVIPVFKKTYDVLEARGYSFPKTTNQESNWKLKEIGRLAGITQPVTMSELKKGRPVKVQYPKYKLISTHTSRRSMATNMYMAGVDLKTIQLFGGWKSIAALERYLKIGKETNAVKASDHAFFKDK